MASWRVCREKSEASEAEEVGGATATAAARTGASTRASSLKRAEKAGRSGMALGGSGAWSTPTTVWKPSLTMTLRPAPSTSVRPVSTETRVLISSSTVAVYWVSGVWGTMRAERVTTRERAVAICPRCRSMSAPARFLGLRMAMEFWSRLRVSPLSKRTWAWELRRVCSPSSR